MLKHQLYYHMLFHVSPACMVSICFHPEPLSGRCPRCPGGALAWDPLAVDIPPEAVPGWTYGGKPTCKK